MFFNEMWSFCTITEDTLSIGITFVFHIVSAMVVTVYFLKTHVFCLKLWKISSSYSVGKYKYGFWYNLKYMILNWPFQNRDVPCKTIFLYFWKSTFFNIILYKNHVFSWNIALPDMRSLLCSKKSSKNSSFLKNLCFNIFYVKNGV